MNDQGELRIILESVSASNICSSCHKQFSGDYISIAVHDTGSGINADVLQRIFDPFFTTKSLNKGTGMGLSMVHGIVHENNGHIHVESDRQSGTIFKILIPPIKLAEDQNEKSNDKLKISTFSELDNCNVLVVDDEKSLVHLMKELLETMGCKVSTYTNSKEACEFFRSNPDKFDIVITDQTMPMMTGLEMANIMASLRPKMPVILCSGYSNGLEVKSGNSENIKRVLMKPIDPDELRKHINDLMLN